MRAIHALVPLLCSLSAAGPRAVEADPKTIGIRAGAVLDVRSGQLKKDQLILVRGQLITAVRPASEGAAGLSEVVDLSRSTVLPGLIDARTRTCSSRARTRPRAATTPSS